MKVFHWLVFVANLPGRNQTLRMRVWRSLKASGAGALRDGVYVLPDSDQARALFDRQCDEITKGGGAAYVLKCEKEPAGSSGAGFRALFDRTAEYEEIAVKLAALRLALPRLMQPVARQRLAALQRESAGVAAIDFFAAEPRAQVRGSLAELEADLNARYSPGEPHPAKRAIPRLDRKKFIRRTWATREQLWIDRVCSAWLIQRFIDPKARFMWLKNYRKCPKKAIGFDFDGAQFTHVEAKVTFEVLAVSFGLDHDAGLRRLGALVHYLDVGGLPVPEAAGLATLVAGARALQPDDDALLRAVRPMLDSLYAAFSANETAADEK
jgi:hypothetical protein